MRAKQYPDLYPETFAKALKQTVTLTFSTNAKAVAFRKELYSYRYAVRDELPQSKDHYHSLMKIRMSIKDKTLTLQGKKNSFTEKLNES